MTNVTKLTKEQKGQIIELILAEEKTLGTSRAVAAKCRVGEATISLMKVDKYVTKGEDAWMKVAQALGWNPGGWQIADSTNVKQMCKVLQDAKSRSMWIAVSCKAGSGKSAGISAFMNADQSGNVFLLKCRNWSKRDFLTYLCQTLGINLDKGYNSPDRLLGYVIDFFATRPPHGLLIIDQANSLKPAALTTLIHIYNEFEGKMGVVLSGTNDLEKDIKRGVRYARLGYDELDSRFGRKYVTLLGANLKDVKTICTVNGITDADTQELIFNDCNPVKVKPHGYQQTVNVVEDFRLLKRTIEKHLIKSQSAA